MAVYNGAFLGDQYLDYNYAGNRTYPTRVGISSTADITVEDNTILDGIIGELRIGPRKYNYVTFQNTSVIGDLISNDIIDTTRKYAILKAGVIGKRIKWLNGNSMVIAGSILPLEEDVVKVGISSFGIGYERQNVASPEEKQIRRWPRDWHGENMK